MLNHTVRFARLMAFFTCLIGALALPGALYAQTFSNTFVIAIPSGPGNGEPYPSNITVAGLTGNITAVTVTLTGISHTYPDDIGALLVTPGGQKIRLFTDVGGAFDIAGVNLGFSATAAAFLPDDTSLTTGTFRPTLRSGNHPPNFAAPAPAAPYSTDLTTINGPAAAQNGTWALYIDDDTNDGSGFIWGGWYVTITTLTVPGAPAIGSAAPGNAQATIFFTPPASDGGSPITGYTATCNPGALSASGAASPLVVTGLTNGTAYTCAVTASNAVGSSAASASVNVTPNVPVGRLNDTGQTLCDNGSNVMVACTTTNSGDGATLPRQDGRFGRDPAAATGLLGKIGAGAAGFDFTKICMNGTLNCAGAASNAAAPIATEWACTKDNNTDLIWSLQTQSGTWANATGALPTAANAASRCGFNSGWRLPTRRELLSIVHHGVFNPSIDTGYFPGTLINFYWSADTAPFPATAWIVYFDHGNTEVFSWINSYPVRLVRSGQ